MKIEASLDFSKYAWLSILPFVYFSFAKTGFYFSIAWLNFNLTISVGYTGCTKSYLLLPYISIRFGCSLDYWVSVCFGFWTYHDECRFFMRKSWRDKHER